MLDISQIQVLYEDNHLIAVNKPGGWLVQGDKTGDTPLSEFVKEYIRIRYKKPGNVFVGVTHRIDRPVSGVVVMARTSKALTRMNKLFQDRKIDKTYWSVVEERPEPLEGKLVHYLLKDRQRNITKVYDKPGRRTKDAKKSELSYKLIGEVAGHVLLEVKPKTGRSHQIRAQLASIDRPIRGDIKYGYPRANPDANIHLHCREMSFIHPVSKKEVRITAEPPKEQVWDLFGHGREI